MIRVAQVYGVSYWSIRLVGMPAHSHIPLACVEDRCLLIKSTEDQPASFRNQMCHSQMWQWVPNNRDSARSSVTLF